ncbi:hypothetical protein SB8_09250 [Pseudomonas oryzihabitans]|nr:hypothetical protein SB8_09250 [Pseudomonas psychrotolerans]
MTSEEMVRVIFLFGLLRHVMANDTTGYRARDGMVTGDMPGHTPHHGALDTTGCHARLAEAEQQGGQGKGSKTFHERDLGLDEDPRVRALG